MFASTHVKQGEAAPGNPNPSVPSFQQRTALGMFRGWEEAGAWLLSPVSPEPAWACAGGAGGGCLVLLVAPAPREDLPAFRPDCQCEARRNLASLRCMKAARQILNAFSNLCLSVLWLLFEGQALSTSLDRTLAIHRIPAWVWSLSSNLIHSTFGITMLKKKM